MRMLTSKIEILHIHVVDDKCDLIPKVNMHMHWKQSGFFDVKRSIIFDVKQSIFFDVKQSISFDVKRSHMCLSHTQSDSVTMSVEDLGLGSSS